MRRRFHEGELNLGQKGKLIICTIHGRTIMKGVDIQLFAVGKPKGTTYFKWWEWKPGLAPSKELVTYTNRHKTAGWFDRYTERLLDEWYSRQDFFEAFNQLLQWLKRGKTVAVACYCEPYRRRQCHLSILADLIRDFGYEVVEA